MPNSHFNLSAYLHRIQADAPPPAMPIDMDYISYLMRQQLFNVAFENIDVQQGKGISLEPADIYQKIVTQLRGGYCYEVNGLFAQALDALGVSYQFVAARPMFYPVLRPKTHMALVVHCAEQDYLCDLGFGSYGVRAPIGLRDLNTPITQDFDQFLLRCTDGEYLLQAWVDGGWANQYAFNLSPQEWIDFAPANYLNSTHPAAIFVQKLLIIQHHPAGRTILLGNVLKKITQETVSSEEIAADNLAAIVQEYFGLAI